MEARRKQKFTMLESINRETLIRRQNGIWIERMRLMLQQHEAPKRAEDGHANRNMRAYNARVWTRFNNTKPTMDVTFP